MEGLSVGRRKFIQLAAAAGATLFYSAASVHASGKVEALLLSCMDYRLVDDLTKHMDSLGLTDKYDHVVLAGASAGASHDKFAAWHDTFWSHLQVAIDLHKISKVMIIDHRDCGAYKIAIGKEHAADPKTEYAAHAAILLPLAAKIKEKYPALGVETYLMGLDGKVEDVKAA